MRTAVTENYRSQPATQTVLWMHVKAPKKVIFSEKSLKKKNEGQVDAKINEQKAMNFAISLGLPLCVR